MIQVFTIMGGIPLCGWLFGQLSWPTGYSSLAAVTAATLLLVFSSLLVDSMIALERRDSDGRSPLLIGMLCLPSTALLMVLRRGCGFVPDSTRVETPCRTGSGVHCRCLGRPVQYQRRTDTHLRRSSRNLLSVRPTGPAAAGR